MRKFLLILFLSILFCFLPISAILAVGIAVKPKEINLKVTLNKKTETEILIINVAKEPALYQVYPDALTEMIAVAPTDFKLEPNGNQIVTITIKAKKLGLFATNISAVARPLGAGGLPAAAGLKIPITITASGIPFWWLILGVIGGICLLVIFRVKLIKKGKPEIKND